MTRFALHRSNLFGSFPDLQSHRAQTKKHSIAPWMTWPMPRIIFSNRWSPMRRRVIAKTKQQKRGHTPRNVLVRSSLTRGSDTRIDRAMLRTPLCKLVGIEHPIIAAPMGPDLTGPELVAAVSNAGGLGILQAQLAPLPLFRRELQRVRELTDKPFGVNLILHFPIDEQVAVCIEERVPVVSFFWGDPTPYVERVHAGGGKVFHQVGSVAEAQRAAKANVDVIIAQGAEAGGHIAGEVSTLALVPRVVDAVAPCPVAAAGGIADGRGIVAALALGAQAAAIGTRFLASVEARAHPDYKKKLVA